MAKLFSNVIRYLAALYFTLLAKVFVGSSGIKVTGTVTNYGTTYGVQHSFTRGQHSFKAIMLVYPEFCNALAFKDAPAMQEKLDVVDFGCVFMDVTSALNPATTTALGLQNVRVSMSSLTKVAALTLFPNVSREVVCCADTLRIEDNKLVVISDSKKVVYDYYGEVVDVVEG